MVGGLPTISMIFASLVVFNVNISSTFESTAQNFCAGLILGAVAKELFPQIDNVSKSTSMIGISCGFFIGLFFVNFLDYFVDLIQRHICCLDDDDEDSGGGAKKMDIESHELLSAKSLELQKLAAASRSYQSLDASDRSPVMNAAMAEASGRTKTGVGERERDKGRDRDEENYSESGTEETGSDADQDPAIMLLASQAIASPMHR